VRDGQTSPHRPRLVVSRSTCPPLSSPPPREQLCTRSCSNKTHRHSFIITPSTPAPVTAPPWVGSRSPDGWDQIPRWAGGWVLHQPPWSLGFDSQTRGTRENRRTLCKSNGFLRGPTGLGSSSLVSHVLQYPPPPHANSIDLLYLCDSEATLNKVSRWIGSGPRTTLDGDTNTDIMTSIIECVRERVLKGAHTFLVKVKAH
jgi:hypothetical protein